MFSESAFHHPPVLHSLGRLHQVAKSAEMERGWPALWVTSQGTAAALGPSPRRHVCSKALAVFRHSPAQGLAPLRHVSRAQPSEKPCSDPCGVRTGKVKVSRAWKPSFHASERSACAPKRQRRGVKWSPSAFGSRAPPPPAPPPLLPHIYPLRPHTSLADGFYLKALAGCAANGRALSRLPPSPWSPCADVGARHRLL